VPARTLEIAVAWINRKAETASDGGRADCEFRTLADLADWLCWGASCVNSPISL
jgi:hypothetical protein